MNTPDEFWARVAVGDKDECWPWMGAANNSGYGTLVYAGKSSTAHRVAAYLSYLVSSTAAPRNRAACGFVLHQCDNRQANLCTSAGHKNGIHQGCQANAASQGLWRITVGHKPSRARTDI